MYIYISNINIIATKKCCWRVGRVKTSVVISIIIIIIVTMMIAIIQIVIE